MNDSSRWIYSAVLISILTGLVGVVVSMLVLRRIVGGRKPRPAIGLLVVSLLLLAMTQALEQTRVLLFRLSYDHLISDVDFARIYTSTWNVTATKVGMAVALSMAAAVKLGLYCNHPDDAIIRWAINAAAATFLLWVVFAAVLDLLI